MRILFISESDNSVGSHRIWVNNLSKWLKGCGCYVDINKKYDDNYDVVILGKNVDYNVVNNIRNQNSKSLIGTINPTDFNTKSKVGLEYFDFFIVGSVEERDYYLRYNDNVLIFPLIEDIKREPKEHFDKECITFGYHGNKNHLEQFSPSIKWALEELSKTKKIKLKAIYNKKDLGEWVIGRPNIEVECVQWEYNTFVEEICGVDIGIVPGVEFLNKRKNLLFKIMYLLGAKRGFKNDYMLRFKNTTNAGRAFVFVQLGIPVVSDFMPSSFHLFGDLKSGFLAHSKEAWYNAFVQLSNSESLRTSISNSALKEFNTKYNPTEWAKKLIQEFNTIQDLPKNTVLNL